MVAVYSLCFHSVSDTGSSSSAGYLISPGFAYKTLGLCVNSENSGGSD